MVLWIVVAGLTAIAIAAIVAPLLRASNGAVSANGHDAAVYRDQLAELDREVKRGQMGVREAEAARAEIGRRLLAVSGGDKAGADGRPDDKPHGAPKGAILAGLLGVPAISLALYLALGNPLQPGLPYVERMATAMENRDYDALVEQVESHLANEPQDAQGWSVLAPIYVRQGRYQEAANAYGRVMALRGEHDALMADFGEALVLGNNGIVSEDARRAFDRTLALNPANEKALFYQGMTAKQDGDNAEALRIWRGLVAKGPADAPWVGFVQRNIDTIAGVDGSKAPALSKEQVEGVVSQDAESQQQIIRGMVDGLAERLSGGDGTVDDWVRLARSRMVLGEKDEAAKALDGAAKQFAGDNAALTHIDGARRDLGLTD